MKIGLGLGICRGGAISLDNSFKIEVNTATTGTTASDVFRLALRSGETYDFSWSTNDGTSGTHNTDSNLDLTFPSGSGVYEVTITPQSDGTGFPSVYYNNTNDDTKITKILNWGISKWTNLASAFYGCENMVNEAIDSPDLLLCTSVNRAFRGTTNLGAGVGGSMPICTNADEMYYLSGVTSLPDMTFDICDDFRSFAKSTTSLGTVGTLETLQGGDMYEFFRFSSVTRIEKINMENAVTVSNMFRQTSSALVIVSVGSSIGATNVSNFCYDSGITSFPLTDVSAVATWTNAFFNCTGLTDFPNLVMSGLTGGTSIFQGCTLDTDAYSDLLVSLEANNSNNGYNFHGGNSTYNTAGGVARAALVADHSVAFTDGGAA